MKTTDFLQRYKQSLKVAELSEQLKSALIEPVKLSGMAGSSTAVISSAVYRSVPMPFVFILSSREAAAYFFNDLENLLEEKDFPY